MHEHAECVAAQNSLELAPAFTCNRGVTTTPRSPIEFWFDFGSNYSYISAMRIEEAAADAGRQVLWRPFLLGPIFRGFGWETSPFVLQKEKGAYMWRDMQRECDRFRIAWKQPSVFPRASVLAHRIALLACEEPWVARFCRGVMRRNFVQDQGIEGPDDLAPLLQAAGQDAAHWIARGTSEEAKTRLREATGQAQRRGIFGAPSFFVAGEMFWGNDRLEQALQWPHG
jgi:2-hydroxychromene-2-carboxylate isomerase